MLQGQTIRKEPMPTAGVQSVRLLATCVEKQEFEVAAAHEFHSGHGSSRSLPKWMWVRGVSGVPLSHTARKSPGATSVSVGYEFLMPAS